MLRRLTLCSGIALALTQACSADDATDDVVAASSSASSTTSAASSGAGGTGGSGGGTTSAGAGGEGGCITGTGGGTVRVATWNIQAVGAPGSTEHEAALAVLDRIDADVVGINEVNGEAELGYLDALAFDAGYEEYLIPADSPFGTPRSAILTRLQLAEATTNTSASLSGDAAANDITRLIPEVSVIVNGCPLTVVTHHWKSGAAQDDQFRRAVESFRVAGAVGDLDPTADPFVLLGDVNAELDEVSPTPSPFFAAPAGLPPAFVVGADIQAQLASPEGLVDDAFSALLAVAPALEALQLDGTDGTRPDSGNRLDYLFASAAFTSAIAETYDSADELLGGGLPKAGDTLPDTTSAAASDHLPVFADVTLPACTCE